MGAPKEGVLLTDGRPMLAHVLTALRPVCTQVVVVGACRGIKDRAQYPDVLWLPDYQSGLGPLAGLESLLASKLDTRYLVVGCDQPRLKASYLARLCREVPPETLGFFQSMTGVTLDPMPGIFPASWLPAVQKALSLEQRSFRALIAQAPAVHWVELAEREIETLESLNTPEALISQLSNAHWTMPFVLDDLE